MEPLPKTGSQVHSTIFINNRETLAFLDCGANTTMLDRTFAESLQIFTDKSFDHLVTSWDNTQQLHKLFISKPFTLSSNGITFTTKCYITTNLGHPIAIGTDLWSRCGFGISGLNPTANLPKTPSPDLDTQQRPITFSKLNNDLTPEQFAEFMKAIQPALDRNAKIPSTSKCTIRSPRH